MSGANKKRRPLAVILLAAALAVALLALPLALTAAVAEYFFSSRYETEPLLVRDAALYEGLFCERHDFLSDKNQRLAGYLYTRAEPPKALVVFAHGFGGGGQRGYTDIINYLTTRGYAVFSYDATGNDESEGRGSGGFAQGAIDLDFAIKRAKTLPALSNIPLFVLGYSWGAYSAGCALASNEDVVAAAALVSGFNSVEDMLVSYAEPYIGGTARLLVPYFSLYEYLRFGEAARLDCVAGIASTEARVLIAHSAADATVPIESGYDLYHAQYGGDPRVTFIHYTDKAHSNMFYSSSAAPYRTALFEHMRKTGEDATIETLEGLFGRGFDAEQLFTLDYELLDGIADFFDSALK